MTEVHSLQFGNIDLWERLATDAGISGAIKTERVSLMKHIKVPTAVYDRAAQPRKQKRDRDRQEPAEANPPPSATKPTCIHLDLENLKSFEVVDQQFEQWGVTFMNAIALQPSNPAFPPRSGTMVLIGGPRSGWLEASFRYPASFVSCFVTSSRQVVLCAYNWENNAIAQVEMPEANLAGSNSAIAPNRQLTLEAANIYRITLYAFDGQFSLDDFQFCLSMENP